MKFVRRETGEDRKAILCEKALSAAGNLVRERSSLLLSCRIPSFLAEPAATHLPISRSIRAS
jgi:hypothetical protein